jgi:mediator of RNA polymerase II transcription subunit 5
VNLSATLDIESLGHLSKILYLHEEALDIISLHVKVSDLISLAVQFLEEYDCETVGRLEYLQLLRGL